MCVFKKNRDSEGGMENTTKASQLAVTITKQKPVPVGVGAMEAPVVRMTSIDYHRS